MEEIEVKFLDIEVDEIREKLRRLGAKKVFEKLYRRKMFDYPDWRLDKQGAWVRLRDEGDKVTLTFKQRLGEGLDGSGKINDLGMEELELSVSDFDVTGAIFKKMGFVEKRFSENRRERYELDGVTFDLDSWPMIPTYLEIEAGSWKEVEESIGKLGLDPKDKKIYSAKQVYMVYGIDEDDYGVITFEKQVKKSY